MLKLTFLIVATVLAGCGGGGGGSSQPDATGIQGGATPLEQIAPPKPSGALATLDRGPSLPGPDANSNGVRDDIDAFITSQHPETAQRAAATQFARSIQAAVVADVTNRPAVGEVVKQMARATNCVYARFPASGSLPPAAVGAKLEAITTSTKARLMAYLAFNRSFNGGSVELPEGDTCE